MPSNHEWQVRIKAVEREYLAMRQASDRFREAALDDPTILQGNLQWGEIVTAAENLEATYVIRLFAEFESGARQFWQTIRPTNPPTSGLLDGLAARCYIPHERLENGHSVRLFRNNLVHERDDHGPQAFPIAEARRHLCIFFSFLPPAW